VPFDLERERGPLAEALRSACPGQFKEGGDRLAVPLCAGGKLEGVAVLADRVNAVPYSVEERELLTCIADQAAAALLNLRLRDAVLQARELEAFQTVSAFFVHDMKNAASGLNLMLKNLPVHFENPEFRADALRAVEKTAGRINGLVGRLSAVREKLVVNPVPCDLDAVVDEAVQAFAGAGGPGVERERGGPPGVRADPEQIGSVVTNLLHNARDAIAAAGNGAAARIRVATGAAGGSAFVTVADNGCGMSAEFVEGSLFRPFQTTKKHGLGIGMFQSRAIVEAHGGRIQVDSTPGKGTTFRVSIPAAAQAPNQGTAAH
jgi:putative PEP-CTERM system histidine kinase